MKTLFAVLFTTFTCHAFAQQKPAFHLKSFKEMIAEIPVASGPKSGFFLGRNKSKSSVAITEGKIVPLSLDNMPCFVPDTRAFNMPVAMQTNSSHMPVFVPVR
jgi:hypothetical protein